MDVDGILVNDTDMRGYSCQIIGDLECEDGEMPACSGQTWHRTQEYFIASFS